LLLIGRDTMAPRRYSRETTVQQKNDMTTANAQQSIVKLCLSQAGIIFSAVNGVSEKKHPLRGSVTGKVHHDEIDVIIEALTRQIIETDANLISCGLCADQTGQIRFVMALCSV